MDQDEKLWQEFNDWHRTRYGWRVHEDLRNHPRENYYAWEAWKAGFANGTKTQDTPVERAELEKLAYDLHRARLEGTWPPTLGTEFPRWRDVADEPPQKAQEVLFVHGGKTVHGAWIGGAFWHNNQRCSAATWLPLPMPPKPCLSGELKYSEEWP